MPIDPVCGMTADEKSAAGTTVHAGKTWYFCSSRCQHEFEANPDKYAGGGKASTEASHGHDHTQHHDHGMTGKRIKHRWGLFSNLSAVIVVWSNKW